MKLIRLVVVVLFTISLVSIAILVVAANKVPYRSNGNYAG